MTDRKKALEALLEKVEAGDDVIRTSEFVKAFDPLLGYDAAINAAAWAGHAYHGSINSAVSFINATLPGWWWSIGTCKISDDARISPEGDASVRNGKEWSEITDVDLRPPGNPARALLMSGLIALIEQEGGE